MSAIAAIFERANTLVDPGVLARLMACMKHRAPDGSDVYLVGNVALGHGHFWTTPEEKGERQPLSIAGLPFKIVLDGRLDNREDLLSRLSISLADGNMLSDAAIMLHAYDCFGNSCFEHFIGEYALVIFDERTMSLVCARDSLGDRTLFYGIQGSRVILASESRAVAEVIGTDDVINENAVAYYLARKAPQDGQTLYKEVVELLPAHAMMIDSSGVRTWRYWEPNLSRKLRGCSTAEYAEQFRHLLEESVRCRIRSINPVGVLMSGGLDSTSVASLAARLIAPDRVTTISYVYDELKECDEQQYIDAVSSMWNTRSIKISCDDAWPMRDWNSWPYDPNYPEGTPYRLHRERAFIKARQEGIQILLTGEFGDHLYTAGDDWLADLLVDGRFKEAARELGLYLRYGGFRWLYHAGYIQRAIGHWRLVAPAIRWSNFRQNHLSWMTDFSNRQVFNLGIDSEQDLSSYVHMLGLTTALGSSRETFHTNSHALEGRHPYRDRRLVEFVLSLPADQLYYHNVDKRILRYAMKGILPEIVRTRRKPTTVESLFFRGFTREKERIKELLSTSGEALSKYVRSDWLASHWDVSMTKDSSVAAIIWSCVAYLRWIRQSYPEMAV